MSTFLKIKKKCEIIVLDNNKWNVLVEEWVLVSS